MTQEKTTLREFINKLEKLSENGKYDNDECYDIGWYGFDTVYPQNEVEENNPQNGEKCFIIQF